MSLTRSPNIVLLDHVRIIKINFVRARQVSDSRMTLKNFVSGNNLPIPMLGTCSWNVDDLSRYGTGGCGVTVYPTKLLFDNERDDLLGVSSISDLGCATYVSPAFNVI